MRGIFTFKRNLYCERIPINSGLGLKGGCDASKETSELRVQEFDFKIQKMESTTIEKS